MRTYQNTKLYEDTHTSEYEDTYQNRTSKRKTRVLDSSIFMPGLRHLRESALLSQYLYFCTSKASVWRVPQMRRQIVTPCSCDCVLEKQVSWVPEMTREIAAAGRCKYVPVNQTSIFWVLVWPEMPHEIATAGICNCVPVKQVYWVPVWPEMPGEIVDTGNRVRGIRKTNMNCPSHR